MSSPTSEDTTANNAAASQGVSSDGQRKEWVKFEEESAAASHAATPAASSTPRKTENEEAPAQIKPESITVNVSKINKSLDPGDSEQRNDNYSGAVIATNSVQINFEPTLQPSAAGVYNPKSASLKTIDLRDASNGRNVISTPIGNIRQGFANGDTIVTLLPVNTKWPWITPARFRPELVPEELMAQGLTVGIFYCNIKMFIVFYNYI